MTTLTELTVRQVGQVTPPLKQKIEQFQQIIDSNDQSVARLREHLRRLEPERERLSELVQQRQDDRRSIHSQLARLQDSLATLVPRVLNLKQLRRRCHESWSESLYQASLAIPMASGEFPWQPSMCRFLTLTLWRSSWR